MAMDTDCITRKLFPLEHNFIILHFLSWYFVLFFDSSNPFTSRKLSGSSIARNEGSCFKLKWTAGYWLIELK